MKTYQADIQMMNGKPFEKMLPPNDWWCPFCDSLLYVELGTKAGDKLSIQCFNPQCQAHATAKDIESAYSVLVQLEIEQTNLEGGDYRDTTDYYER